MLKINLYNLDIKKTDVPLVHSVYLFLCYKSIKSISSFKYSEIHWMSENTCKKALNILSNKKIISLLQKPSIKNPVIIKLNDYETIKKEIIQVTPPLNRLLLTKNELSTFINCKKIREHFHLKNFNAWLKSVNIKKTKKSYFMLLCKIVSYFESNDPDLKTKTVNKYIQKEPRVQDMVYLIDTLSSFKKEILLTELQKLTNKKSSLANLVQTFLNQQFSD